MFSRTIIKPTQTVKAINSSLYGNGIRKTNCQKSTKNKGRTSQIHPQRALPLFVLFLSRDLFGHATKSLADRRRVENQHIKRLGVIFMVSSQPPPAPTNQHAKLSTLTCQ
jgi:hypothetical protein